MERAERSAVPLTEAAALLGVPEGTLRRWTREGCPHTPGRRGRGCATLVDPVAVRRWLGADARDAALLELAGLLPGLMAEAAIEAWAQIDDPAKRRAAGWLAAAWYMSVTTALDAMRAQCPAVPELDRLPEPIERLQKIARSA